MNCPTTVSTSTLSRRGFTIVEALVAGVILSLSAVALGATVSHCMRSLTLARDYQRAAELLDLPWLDLRTRFLRLDVPLRTAPADLEDTRQDVEAAERWPQE